MALLRIKHAAEKEIKAELMQVQMLCDAKRREIEETGRKTVEWTAYYDVVVKSRAVTEELAIIDRHIASLHRYRDQLSIALDVLERKRADVVMQYQAIRKDVQVLEKIEETRREEHRLEMGKWEEKEADEMASLRYTREREVAYE